MGAPDVLARLSVLGIRLTRDGNLIRATPRLALTDEARSLIRANKGALLTALAVRPAIPADLEGLLLDLHPTYGWEADELATLRKWAADDPEQARAALLQSKRLANEGASLLQDVDELLDKMGRLGFDPDQLAELRAARRRASLISLLTTRDELRRLVSHETASPNLD